MSNFSDETAGGAWDSSTSTKVPGPLPGGLKAICIIAIILGAMGIIGSLIAGAGLIIGPALQEAQQMQGVQQQMQTEINAVARQYLIPSVTAAILQLFTAFLLIVGSIMVLQRKRAGLGTLTLGCAGSILYLIGHRILYAIVTVKALPIYEEYGPRLMAEAARDQQAPDMPNFVLIFAIVGLVFAILWALAISIFYLVSILYLRKPKVVALFDPPEMMAKGF